jgi:hypothetical protein
LISTIPSFNFPGRIEWQEGSEILILGEEEEQQQQQQGSAQKKD